MHPVESWLRAQALCSEWLPVIKRELKEPAWKRPITSSVRWGMGGGEVFLYLRVAMPQEVVGGKQGVILAWRDHARSGQESRCFSPLGGKRQGRMWGEGGRRGVSLAQSGSAREEQGEVRCFSILGGEVPGQGGGGGEVFL
ncbi:unnamed protein product [Eretmochelys imbricata]